MDISEITDITKLKALAYDQLALLQQTQQNLDLINQRIAQLLDYEQTFLQFRTSLAEEPTSRPPIVGSPAKTRYTFSQSSKK